MTTNKDIRNETLKYFEVQQKANGFQKKGNSLVRETEKGLIQVIDFSLGQSTSITHNHLGLGFGIYTNEWFELLGFGSKPKIITGSHCELRSAFNEFIPKDDWSSWIDLHQTKILIIEKCQTLINDYFLIQLNSLISREKIIEQWKLNGNAIGLPPRGKLSIAILYWHMNNRDMASKLLEEELAENHGKPYYNFVIKIRTALNNNNNHN